MKKNTTYMRQLSLSLLTFFLVATGLTLHGQGKPMLMDQDEFKSKMNSAGPLGFRLLETETDEDEYTATFTKGSAALIIAAYPAKRFNDYRLSTDRKSAPPREYSLDGMRAVYFTWQGLSYLYLEAKDMNLMVSIAGKPLLGKDQMEKAARDLKLQSWKPATQDASWPAEITAEQRIAGTILSIEKTDPSTDGFIYEYHVKAVYNKQLVQSVEKILTRFGGDLDVCHMGKFVFISSSASNMDDFRSSFKEGEVVEFIYYRKGK